MANTTNVGGMSLAPSSGMQLPQRFLNAIARDLPVSFERIDRLHYVGAVALAAGEMKDRRVDTYVRFFKAEQEGDADTMNRMLQLCEDYSEREEYAQVAVLLRGRRLLLERGLTAARVRDWFAESERFCLPRLLGYLNFLAGIGGLQAGDLALSAEFLERSAVEYARVGERSRELQSLLQNPRLPLTELRYLRSYARHSGDQKACHVADLQLATVAKRMGDPESARHHARRAVRAFRESFLDPRRERIGLGLLAELDPARTGFTVLERRVLDRLAGGPRTKSDLIEDLYGRAGSSEALDARFRTLLSRLNKKMSGAIVKSEAGYQIRRD